MKKAQKLLDIVSEKVDAKAIEKMFKRATSFSDKRGRWTIRDLDSDLFIKFFDKSKPIFQNASADMRLESPSMADVKAAIKKLMPQAQKKQTILEYKVPLMYRNGVERWGKLEKTTEVPAPTEKDPNAKKEVKSDYGMGWKRGEDYEIIDPEGYDAKTGKRKNADEFYFTVKIMNPRMLSIKEIRDVCVYGQRDVASRQAELKAAKAKKEKEAQQLNENKEGEAQ